MDNFTKVIGSPEFGVFRLTEYIHAFRSSSDRARYVIFVNTIVSLLMLIAAWNYHHLSWSRKAADLYRENREKVLAAEWKKIVNDARANRVAQEQLTALLSQPLPAGAAANLQRSLDRIEHELAERQPLRDTLALQWRYAQWKDREQDLEWYGGQTTEFYERGIFVPVPGLGSWLHVNDMALIGGLVLLALTALLWISLIRQHENLYLALFKLEQIRRSEGTTASDQDSVSNFFYHALAMAQVLSHPPTLARWNRRIRHIFLHLTGAFIVYFLPGIVQAAIVVQNLRTRKIAYEVWTADVARVRLGIQVLFTLGILTCCFLAFRYARCPDFVGNFSRAEILHDDRGLHDPR
jgi:hypothetical protein